MELKTTALSDVLEEVEARLHVYLWGGIVTFCFNYILQDLSGLQPVPGNLMQSPRMRGEVFAINRSVNFVLYWWGNHCLLRTKKSIITYWLYIIYIFTFNLYSISNNNNNNNKLFSFTLPLCLSFVLIRCDKYINDTHTYTHRLHTYIRSHGEKSRSCQHPMWNL